MAMRKDRKPQPRGARTPLGALIEEVRHSPARIGSNGRPESYQHLADRATSRGHPISKQHMQAIATKPMTTLVPGTLQALSVALDVPLARIVELAIPSAQLPMPVHPEDWSVEAAIQADDDLPEAAKRILLTMLASARSDPVPQPVPQPAAPSNVKPLKRQPHVKAAARKPSRRNDLAAREDMDS